MYKVAIETVDNYRIESIYNALVQGFSDMGYDTSNPFGKANIIQPGNTVFIKPNWVASRWRESCAHKDSLYSVITHPSVIEGVVDFVAKALDGKGKIILGDNPSIDADFNELMEFTGIRKLEKKYNGLLKIVDLRPLVCTDLKYYGKKDKMVHQTGDLLGTVEVNIGKESLLYGIDPTRFRGVFDQRDETIASHTGEQQLYTYAKSLYNADVYISIPKLKTHQKVGATLNLKGLVGSVSNKNQLVHWQVGYPEIHGDEYSNKEAYEESQKARVKHRGAWPGNDTIWRMVVDLYRGLIKRDRKYFSVVDGVVGGEGQGPFCPTSKFSNTLILGDNLLATDCVAVRYMGLDPLKIRYLKHFCESLNNGIDLRNIEVSNKGTVLHKEFFESKDPYLDFSVPEIWKEIKVNR